MRYTTTIASSVSAETVRELVAVADRNSPVLDDLRRALAIRGDLRVLSGNQRQQAEEVLHLPRLGRCQSSS